MAMQSMLKELHTLKQEENTMINMASKISDQLNRLKVEELALADLVRTQNEELERASRGADRGSRGVDRDSRGADRGSRGAERMLMSSNPRDGADRGVGEEEEEGEMEMELDLSVGRTGGRGRGRDWGEVEEEEVEEDDNGGAPNDIEDFVRQLS